MTHREHRTSVLRVVWILWSPLSCPFSGLAWDYQGHVTLPCCILSLWRYREKIGGLSDKKTLRRPWSKTGNLFTPVFTTRIYQDVLESNDSHGGCIVILGFAASCFAQPTFVALTVCTVPYCTSLSTVSTVRLLPHAFHHVALHVVGTGISLWPNRIGSRQTFAWCRYVRYVLMLMVEGCHVMRDFPKRSKIF